MRKPAQPRTVMTQVLADLKYWTKLSKALDWQLKSFTYRHTATFETANPPNFNSMLQVTAFQRDSILNAISAAVNKTQRKFK